MKYFITATSTAKVNASIQIKKANILLGTTDVTEDTLPNPAELFLGSLAACILKSVERFSTFLNFEYDRTSINVNAIREERPPYLDDIHYELTIYTKEDIPVALLQKNLEKYGTIFNTVKKSCSISGSVKCVVN